MPLSAGSSVGWDRDKLPAWPSPGPREAIITEGGTEIKWMPDPYRFKVGPSVGYLDYEGGDDAKDGLSPATAWQHYPRDAQAKGKASTNSGIHTYVFKGGVTYRGSLVGRESGTAQEPIRLTRDPNWGNGPAVLSGSVQTTNWRRLPSEAQDQPAEGVSPNRSIRGAVRPHLWVTDLPGDFLPKALWIRSQDGGRQRLPLARSPNWKIEHPDHHFTQWLRVEKIEPTFPRTTIFAPKVLIDPDPKALEGAILWGDHANTSGEFSIIGPFPSSAQAYDPETGCLIVAFTHPGRHPQPNSPFFLENMPGFLDEAGEWWFDEKKRAIHVWFPEHYSPENATIEVAQHRIVLDLESHHYVEISGLHFTGGSAIDLHHLAVGEVAGNVVNRTAAQDIDLVGSRIRQTSPREPLSSTLPPMVHGKIGLSPATLAFRS